MNGIIAVFSGFFIVMLGLNDCIKYRKNIRALQELLSFIDVLKNDIVFKKSSFPELLAAVEKEAYSFIKVKEGAFFLDGCTDKNAVNEFKSFTSKIGTTDDTGQISLCDSSKAYFQRLYNEMCSKEKSKMQVNLSLGILGAVSLIIVFC